MYRKIDIYVNGKYVASTNRSKTCKAAVTSFIAHPVVQSVGGPKRITPGKIQACFAETRKRRNPLGDSVSKRMKYRGFDLAYFPAEKPSGRPIHIYAGGYGSLGWVKTFAEGKQRVDAELGPRKRRNPRVPKTEKEYVIQGHYGSGWEDVNYETSMADARRSLKEYRENQPGAYRLRIRRVKI